MDWLRRNWPDLLIGVALVAVIAGIVATLMSGGSLFPLGRSDGPTRVVTQDPRPVTSTSRPDSAADSADARPSGEAQGDILPVLPDLGTVPPTTGPVVGQDGPNPSTGAGTERPDGAPADEGAGFVRAPASGAPFRVSAGAYSVRSYADVQVERLREAGYPVFTGRQGDLYLVMVGPYDDRGRAEQVAGELESRELVLGPLVYECTDCGAASPPAADQAGAANVQEETAAPAAASAEATGDAQQEAAGPADDGLYLQVGAYASLSSAGPQRERMQELGYTVTVRRSNDLVKLLIGPFDDSELSAAQERLGSQGIENFATR